MAARAKVVLTGLGLSLAFLAVLAPADATPPSARHAGARVAIAPAISLADEPLDLRLTGLPAGVTTSVELSSTDAAGTRWQSSADFRTDALGRVDVARTPARGGSYRGVWDMGLLDSMTARTRTLDGAYAWRGDRPLAFDARVFVDGRLVASRSFLRRLSAKPVVHTVERLGTTGFVGEYFAPVGATGRTAVLAFGGAAGGLRTTLLASMFAAHGYPTLALAYFKAPGLPQGLHDIPLEYFAKALRWLRDQPAVDPGRIFTLGISRGSEAALLLGVHYPELVHGVIGAVPDNRAICIDPTCPRPPWTLGGVPIPFTHEFDNPRPTDNPSAVIPVERIHGPVFLACAEADRTWPSCAFARAVVARLVAHASPYRHELVAVPHAGHRLGSLTPNEPVVESQRGAPVDARARAEVWPRLLAFLQAASG